MSDTDFGEFLERYINEDPQLKAEVDVAMIETLAESIQYDIDIARVCVQFLKNSRIIRRKTVNRSSKVSIANGLIDVFGEDVPYYTEYDGVQLYRAIDDKRIIGCRLTIDEILKLEQQPVNSNVDPVIDYAEMPDFKIAPIYLHGEDTVLIYVRNIPSYGVCENEDVTLFFCNDDKFVGFELKNVSRSKNNGSQRDFCNQCRN